MSTAVTLAFLAITVAVLVRILINRIFSYWTRLGVHQLQPTFPFGDYGAFVGRQKLSACEFYHLLYNRTKHLPYVGVYFFFKPILVVNDLQLINRIMIQDFPSFNGRGVFYDEQRDPLSAHLTALAGEKWRQVRLKVGPAFTPNKLKGMFHTMLATALTLQQYLEQFAASGENVDALNLFSRYANDIIASVAFGIEVDSIYNPSERFLAMAETAFESKLSNLLRWTTSFFFPTVMKYSGARMFCRELEDFMLDVVQQTAEYREKNNICRKDIMQLLLQLRNSGSVSSTESWQLDASAKVKTICLKELTAQAFTFLMAGYETTSSAMSFCMYELARYPSVQRKVQQEIDDTLKQTNGEFTYDGMIGMKYLEACVDETLRKFPPIAFLQRVCNKDYPVDGTNLVLRKDTMVLVPIDGLHRDEEYYPSPNDFLPERFINGKATGKPFFAFGEGPRQCIGAKMGKLEAMIGLAALLAKYDFDLVDPKQRLREPITDPNRFTNHILGGVRVTVKKRSDVEKLA